MLLMVIGFFGAAFVSVRHADSAGLGWRTVEWGWYVLAFFVGAAGVVLLRVAAKGTDTGSEKLEADIQTLETALSSLVGKLRDMNTKRETINVYDVHETIDRDLVQDLGTFVEARESLIPRYGLQSYADLMSRFALGERSINRAWSASADGYIDEVWICVSRAEAQMSGAQALLMKYRQRN